MLGISPRQAFDTRIQFHAPSTVIEVAPIACNDNYL